MTNIIYREKILICQAPADIPYVLSLYENFKDNYTVSIFVINIENNYKFLSTLNLNIKKLIYIPYKYIHFKNPYYFFTEKKRIETLWNFINKNFDQIDVYFFSIYEDWITGFLIHKFFKIKKSKIFYCNHYDISGTLYCRTNVSSFGVRYYLFILKYLTGVKFNANILEKLPEFPLNDYSIHKFIIEINPIIYRNFSYKPNNISNKNFNILFFISNCDKTTFDEKYYDKTLLNIIKKFKSQNCILILKKHPRIELNEIFSDLFDIHLPTFVPGELIYRENINICIGIDTNTIAFYSKETSIPTFSIFNLFKYSNINNYESVKNFLISQSNNKLKFLHNLNDIEKIIYK